MSEPILPPLKPIPIKDRISVVYIEKGNLDERRLGEQVLKYQFLNL
jgi:hypothetical protein